MAGDAWLVLRTADTFAYCLTTFNPTMSKHTSSKPTIRTVAAPIVTTVGPTILDTNIYITYYNVRTKCRNTCYFVSLDRHGICFNKLLIWYSLLPEDGIWRWAERTGYDAEPSLPREGVCVCVCVCVWFGKEFKQSIYVSKDERPTSDYDVESSGNYEDK